MADTLAEAECATFGDTLSDLNGNALVNTVGDTLARTPRRTPRHIARGNGLSDVEATTFSDKLAAMLNYSKAETLQEIVDEAVV